MLEVTVREVKNLGKTLDAVASAGANRIDGVRFESSNPREALDVARLQAVQEARARADLYAQAVGLKVARVALIEEGGVGGEPQPAPLVRLAKADFATPVEPGEISLSVAIVATFELQ